MRLDAPLLQQKFLALRENKLFETFVIFVIVFSALLIGAKTYGFMAWCGIFFLKMAILYNGYIFHQGSCT